HPSNQHVEGAVGGVVVPFVEQLAQQVPVDLFAKMGEQHLEGGGFHVGEGLVAVADGEDAGVGVEADALPDDALLLAVEVAVVEPQAGAHPGQQFLEDIGLRSEERRVGKGGRSAMTTYGYGGKGVCGA